MPDAGVLEKISNAEVGPAETVGTKQVMAQPATANGVRMLGYMMLAEECQIGCEGMEATNVLETGCKPSQIKRNIRCTARSTVLHKEDLRNALQRPPCQGSGGIKGQRLLKDAP